MAQHYARRQNGRTVEVIAPAYYEADVLAPLPEDAAEDATPEVLHRKGEEIDIAARFHPDFVAQLVPYDPTNPPVDELPVETPPTADEVRTERQRLLNMSDWTQLADVPSEVQETWRKYRQALRDVPAQSGFPEKVKWPKAPE